MQYRRANSAGIQRGFGKRIQWSQMLGQPLAQRGAASAVEGGEDLRPFEVTETTGGRPSQNKANINCATSSENNGGQDTRCALIHISIVCPPPLLLLRARSISGVKEERGGEKCGGGGGWGGEQSSSGGSGGLAVFFLLCLCANAQTVQ